MRSEVSYLLFSFSFFFFLLSCCFLVQCLEECFIILEEGDNLSCKTRKGNLMTQYTLLPHGTPAEVRCS